MESHQPTEAPPAEEGVQSIAARENKILKWVMAGLVFLLPVLLYWSTFRFDFLPWDDDIEITTNPRIRELSWENLQWMFTDIIRVRRYIPFDWLSWGVTYKIAKVFSGDGLNPAFYHAGNVLIHAMTALLFYFVLRRIVKRMSAGGGISESALAMIAGFGALYWAVHPLRVEAVAWANGRIHEQALFFVAVSFLCYLRAYDADRGAVERRGLFVISLVAYVFSLLSYGTGLGYVVVLVAADLVILRRRGIGVWIEKIPFVLAGMAWLALNVWAGVTTQGFWDKPVSLAQFGVLDRLMQAAYVLAYYCWKPFSSHFSPVYTTLVGFNALSWPFILSAVFVAVVTAAAWAMRRRWPVLLGVWACHVALLFPMLGLTEHPHYTSDRYAYMEGMIWSVLLCALIVKGLEHRGQIGVWMVGALPGALLLGAAVLTISQIAVWRNGETLFRHTIFELGNEPYAAEMHARLADYLVGNHRPEEAVAECDVALQIVPKYQRALYAKGLALLQVAGAQAAGSGRDAAYLQAGEMFDEEEEVSHAAVSLKWAGYAYVLMGRLEMGEERLESALRMESTDNQTRVFLANIYHQDKKDELAMKELDEAVRLDPTLAATRAEMLKGWAAATTSAPASSGR